MLSLEVNPNDLANVKIIFDPANFSNGLVIIMHLRYLVYYKGKERIAPVKDTGKI